MNNVHFYVGTEPVGAGCSPLFLADIGTFFNTDVDQAVAMVHSLQQAGLLFVKGEILHRPDVCLDDDTLETYYDPATGQYISERYRDLVERKVLSLEQYARIFAAIRDSGLQPVMSVYDFDGADFAIEQGCVALKVASSNITHEPLIRYLAEQQAPVLIDTGNATFAEIARAVQWAWDAGGEQLIVQHSPARPPAPVREQRLHMLETLHNAFGLPVGLSDHHAGNEMMIAAVALGANVLEKGVCADSAEVDQDVAHAMRLSEVANLRQQCVNVFESLVERGRWLPTPEIEPKGRMGLVARAELRRGDKIGVDTTDFAFPPKGIPCSEWSRVRGWTVVNDVAPGRPIGWNDVAPLDP